MRIKQLTLENNHYNSFHIRHERIPRHQHTWHYHEELELILIRKGYGTLFIGDRIQEFEPGIIVLIGSNLPHYWHFSRSDTEEIEMDGIVIHFKEEFAGSTLLNLPEMENLKYMLTKAKVGILIENKHINQLSDTFHEVLQSKGSFRIIGLLRLLADISELPHLSLVSSTYAYLNNQSDEKRMNQIMSYIQKHYLSTISIDILANEAQMTKNSFCRYFKLKTGKSPIQFIMELRIGYAARLLKNKNLSLQEICFASGFNNFVHFHKTFKTFLHTTPNQFRKIKG